MFDDSHFFSPVVVDAQAASVIAAGMKAVARADGEIHARELELISAFEESIPTLEEGGQGMTPEVRQVYLRSLVMVALADGTLSDDELPVITSLAEAQGFTAEDVRKEVEEVRSYFLSYFDGVKVFSGAMDEIKENLG